MQIYVLQMYVDALGGKVAKIWSSLRSDVEFGKSRRIWSNLVYYLLMSFHGKATTYEVTMRPSCICFEQVSTFVEWPVRLAGTYAGFS